MTILIAFISVLLTFPLKQSEPIKPVIAKIVECSELEHDFGQVTTDSLPISCTFVLKNISDKDIYIAQICTTCSCTSVKWDRQIIHSGEKKEISVTYDDNKETTKFNRSIIVYLSDTKNPFSLRIKGEVCPKK